MKKIIFLITSMDLIKFRFKTIFENSNFDYQLVISNSKIDALHKLNYYNNKVDLLIVDLEDYNKVSSLMKELKIRKIENPVIYLSDSSDRKSFVRIVKLGIDDYIIKPFDDKRMSITLNKYLNEDSEVIMTKVTNYEQDISLAIKRAKKGAYPITFIIFDFIGKNKLFLANKFMKKLQGEIWDTDKALFYTKYAIIGIFPFSGYKNKEVIEEKMKHYYMEVVNSKAVFLETNMEMLDIIFPTNVESYDDLIIKIDNFLKM